MTKGLTKFGKVPTGCKILNDLGIGISEMGVRLDANGELSITNKEHIKICTQCETECCLLDLVKERKGYKLKV